MDHNPETLPETLESLYREIEETRMDGVPILNKKLSVAALGFEPWQDNAMGVLLTPWFMNLMLVPLDQDKFKQSAPREGSKRFLNVPAGQVEFILGFEEKFGWSMSCSLFSPMFEFADQAAAFETAKSALEDVLNENAELDTPEQEMQDIWDGKLPEPEAVAEETEETEEKPAGPAKDMSRRTFLRGTSETNSPDDAEDAA